MNYSNLVDHFQQRFGQAPRVFRSPGRVNIIGEHTDYNQGFVLPAGVDKEIGLVMAPSDSDVFTLVSLDQSEEVSFTLSDYRHVKVHWTQYLIGVIDELLKRDYKPGPVNILFSGDIPIGAGMSSSAALECATVFAFNTLFDLQIEKWDMVKIAQAAENNYVGVKCGIMDQFASMFAQKDHCLLLDCRDLTFESYPLVLEGYELILVNSEVKHSLASSEYNTRRQECEQGLRVMQQKYPEAQSLRDISLADLIEHKEKLSPVVFQRCNYVIREMVRTKRATQAMLENNWELLGNLMYFTHEGLQYFYEVSCEELDFLVDFTRDLPHVLGARMMGGGFGGCTINLVETAKAAQFQEEISKAYDAQYSITPSVYKVTTADGTSEILNF